MTSGRDRNLGADATDTGAEAEGLFQGRTLRRLLDQTGDFVVRIDSTGTVDEISEGVESTLGYEAATLVDEPLETLLAAESDEAAAIQSSLLTEDADSELDVAMVAADNATVHTAVSAVPGPDGGALCLVRDVTEHRERDRELERYIELVESIDDPMYVLDTDGTIIRVNDAMVEYTGYSEDELVGRSITELTPATEHDHLTGRFSNTDDEVSANTDDEVGDSETFETTLVTSDGERILSEANISPLRDDEGQPAGTVGVLRDIRERKRREQNLDLLKQVLTRVFRHNIRNELMVVQGFAEIIESTVESDIEEPLAEIHGAIDSLLEYSEKAREIETVMESPETAEIDLDRQVQRAVAAVEQTHPEATVNVEGLPPTTVDAHLKVTTAIEELLDNAIRHTPADREAEVAVWADEQEVSVTLFIEDNAGGLDDSEIDILQQGTESDLEHTSGVGLWLVRWIVDYSGGELIAHRTESGTLMGIRFARGTRDDQSGRAEESPLAKPPAQVQEIVPERFRGDTVIERVEEHQELQRCYEALERTGGHSVLITGEAGIGKTTLTQQFRDHLVQQEKSPVLGIGNCEDSAQPPYDPFRQVFRELPIDRDLTQVLEDAASLSTVDADEARRRKQALFTEIAEGLRTLASDQPVVLMIEDLHWADSGTIDLFEYLVDDVGQWGNPVMFVGTYRTSDVDQAHPVLEIAEEMTEAGRGTVIELEPFGASDVESLVSHQLDIAEVPESFVEAVHEHTGGTPLFVNELGRHFVDTLGPISSGSDLPENLESVTVPETVERAIAKRIDELPDKVIPVLELGAVIGREFSFDVIRAASERPVDELLETIDTLVQRQVWSRSVESIEFVHGVVREQTLEVIDDEDRERLHEQVATAIETTYADTIDEHAARLAEHYEQIGAVDTAFEYYRRAGDQASETYANEAAIEYYERAVSLGDAHGVVDRAELATVHSELGDVFKLLGKYRQARESYENALEIRREHGDRKREARTLNKIGRVYNRLDEYEQSENYHEEALGIFQDISDSKGEAESLNNLGELTRKQGKLDQAAEYYERALDLARSMDDSEREARSLTGLGVVARRQGSYARASDYFEQGLDTVREIDDQQREASALNNLGIIAYHRDNYTQAREYLERSLTLMRELGDRRAQATILNNLGGIARWQNKYDEAREYYERSLSIRREISDRSGTASTQNNLGEVLRLQQEYEQALEYHESSLEIAQDIDLARHKASSLLGIGAATRGMGDISRARAVLQEALEQYKEIGNQTKIATVHLEKARTELLCGNVDDARSQAERAREQSEQLGEHHDVALSQQVLGEIAVQNENWDRALDHWRDALETFETVGAPHDALQTLRNLVETCREQGDEQQASEWRDRAKQVFRDAPDSVKEQHREWIECEREEN